MYTPLIVYPSTSSIMFTINGLVETISFLALVKMLLFKLCIKTHALILEMQAILV